VPYLDYDDEGRCQGCGCDMTKADNGSTDRRTLREKTVACSPRCHKRVQRERAGIRKEPRPCRFCAELVWDYVGNDVRCPDDDRTDHCDELQYAAEARAAYVAERRTRRTDVCEAEGCAREVTWSGRGRVKTICSPRCRQAVRRARLKEAQ
jgi:hypothetical protein